jgi:hypothetical protein
MNPTEIVQLCSECRAEHTISLSRGAQKTRRGPFALEDGCTLELALDSGERAVTVAFRTVDFADLSSISAEALARKLASAEPLLMAREDFGGCLIESRAEGATSRVAVRGGSACDALGLRVTSTEDDGRPPVLGVVAGEFRNAHLVRLRQCPCGLQEILARNFDRAPEHVAGSFFDRHRRAVNTLAEVLKRRGSSHPELRAHHARETHTPPDLFADLIAGDLAVDLNERPSGASEGD